MTGRRIRVAIVAGETSGDRLGAGLMQALRNSLPEVQFTGVGGPMMEAQGCDILYHMDRIDVIGVDGLMDKIGDILRIRRDLLRRFSGEQPDVFVGIDVPDFNLTLERKLKRAGVTCVHYVSPTVWAWRGYRIRKIRRSIDHMLTLFPFEADYYRRNDVPVTCVGHPMADEIGEPDRTGARHKLGLEGQPVIALLPGSRRSEIRRLAGVFVEAATMIHQRFPGARFILPYASQAVAAEFTKVAGDSGNLPLTTLQGNARLALEACDIAILASGTAALEAALMRRAHVVVYRVTPLSYWLMRRLRHVDYYSMPNHLLPEPMVPELIQDDATAENILAAVESWLNNPQKVDALERQFAKLHRDLKLDSNTLAGEAVIQVAGLAA